MIQKIFTTNKVLNVSRLKTLASFISLSTLFAFCSYNINSVSTQAKNVQYADDDSKESFIPIYSSSSINLKDFGAKGEGISSVKQDTKALEDAIDYLRKRNGGKLFIPPTSKFYAYAGNEIVLSDNIEIYGSGETSTIRNVNPDMNKWYKGVIFFTSTYGPTNQVSIMSQPKYPIEDARKGSTSIQVANANISAKLKEGNVIVLGSNPFSKDKDPNKTRFLNIEQNEIVSINGKTIKLKYPTSIELSTDGGNKPVIVDVNSGNINTVLGIENHTTKNIVIHDLHLSQAQQNEIDNVPLKSTPTSVIQLGGTFESKFYNLWIDGYSGISGNMWARCEFTNINVNSNRNLIDWGYGSHNSKFQNIKYTFLKSPNTGEAKAFIYFSEASHDIQMEDIQASGDWNGSNLLLVGNGAKGLTMRNITLDFPNLVNPNFGINIADQDNKVYSSNILVENVKINVSKLKKFIRCAGENIGVDRNIQFNNVTFSDNSQGAAEDNFVVNNMKGVNFKAVQSNKAKFDMDDVSSQKLKKRP